MTRTSNGGLLMSNFITKRVRLSRRTFLKGLTLTGTSVSVGLPPLVSMFNAQGTAYAAAAHEHERAIETRFVLWFNGNGIPERYWIPARPGQRTSQIHERADELHAFHRTRRGRSVHRSGHRGKARGRVAFPVFADRRLAGILRQKHPAKHELGGLRARLAAGDDPAQTLRPALRPARRRLGQPQAQHPGRGP